MSFRELGERTLITKGTLTGAVARLERRGVVERTPSPTDGRSAIARLTAKGERLFDRAFPEHVGYCRRAFAGWTSGDFDALDERLRVLHDALASHPEREGPHGSAERE